MSYVVRTGAFRGCGLYLVSMIDGEEIFATSQSKALRFGDKVFAELAEACIGDARTVRLRMRSENEGGDTEPQATKSL